MFKYVKYIPMTDDYTTHVFNRKNDKCAVHRFDVPCVSISCGSEDDFTELMDYQRQEIEAVEISKNEFEELVQYSAQVKRMYDVANEQYVKECALITSRYTQEEISTWSAQVSEAEAVKSETESQTPFLDALAEDDGTTIAEAADKILFLRDKNSAYTAGCLTRKWDTLKKLKSEVGL